VISDLTIESAIADYTRLKVCAKRLLKQSRLDESLQCISAAANLAYHLNFKLIDEDLESLLCDISESIISLPNFRSKKKRIVFYDYFGISQRGLTQQYLHALCGMDCDLLYILESSCPSDASDILAKLKKTKGADVLIIPNDLTPTKKVEAVVNAVAYFGPEIAFLHLAPWSAVAVAAWQRFPHVTRYFINITDHSFLLGKCCTDYLIEFRQFGIDVTINKRRVPADKVRLLSYYPILVEHPFLGVPVDLVGKTVIFSGGSLYKMYGAGDAFFRIISRVLNDNANVIVLLAGDGDSRPLDRYISENSLEHRVVRIGNRKDLCHIFRLCDIYLNTHPLGGGLMCQMAAAYQKPIIGYTGIFDEWTEQLFADSHDMTWTFCDIELMHSEINKLIRNEGYRVECGIKWKSRLKTQESFEGELRDLLENPKTVNCEAVKVDWNDITSFYLEVENRYLNIYDKIKFRHLGLRYFKIDFFAASKAAVRLILRDPRAIWKKLLRGLGKR
jgi:hypothetical protein